MTELLQRCLRIFPVVVLTGARQAGKTTLVRQLLGGSPRAFLSLDDLEILAQARQDPASLFTQLPVTIDEVQRAPELLLEVKRQVDRQRTPGMVILTGSANLALMAGVAESLAGRAVYLELPSFCAAEWLAVPGLAINACFAEPFQWQDWPVQTADWGAWLLRGGLPPAVEIADDADRALWLGGYVQTYLERDLRQLSEIADLSDFQRLMKFAAQRVGRLLNQSEIARDAGLKQPTVHRYLNLLETGFQISRLPSLRGNPTTELLKAKKLMFNDCGIAAYLAGMHREPLQRRSDRGFWLEQALYPTLVAWRALEPTRRRIVTWRDRKQREVDFVLQEDDRVVGLEIKDAQRVSSADLQGLEAFEEYVRPTAMHLVRKVVLYRGEECRALQHGAVALPMGCLFPSTNG